MSGFTDSGGAAYMSNRMDLGDASRLVLQAG